MTLNNNESTIMRMENELLCDSNGIITMITMAFIEKNHRIDCYCSKID